jgi:ABC-type multidrug transport system fused ATPase/permease subunit
MKLISDNYKGPSLSFNNVTSRYPCSKKGNMNKDAITLRNVSFSLYAGEKIGVVGRTGAGKSSLVLALYRLLEQVEGEILFDGVDISSLKLERHRSRITIIPQV